ncbi:ABC transporter permease [Allomuricauda sp. SCSIO 65647]|uniref:ABC transporter permease n=1 Tax=Allomuricauda sp. SCSIO 65647 TaxID=2908843 RepID=UPI001F47636B|nr:ABC transporter permease [Muricauda sp. SCSIO 65647]UJH66781.1 ABC transporter permease [Muricauda sp. SCSIO 65647]
MGKLRLIVKREYLAKVRNRSFIIMTFLSPILLVAMVLLIVYLTRINDSEKRVISVLNESEHFSESFPITESSSYVQFEHIDFETAKDSTISLGYYGLLYIPAGKHIEASADQAYLYTKDNPSTYVLDEIENIIQSELRKERLQGLGFTSEQFKQVEADFNLGTSTFDGKQNLKGINEIKAFIGGGFGYLIMMFIIIYGGFVMRSVIEEKTSRIIEVIISSVKPFQLMLGKIIGTSLAGVTQFAIWIFSASLLLVIAALIFDIDLSTLNAAPNMAPSGMPDVETFSSGTESEMQRYAQELFNLPWLTILLSFVLYFILGYLIYSSIYAAIGAAVDNETDTQQFIFPIILPLMLAIYVGFFSVFSNPHGPIAVGFSIFPLTSPIVMLMRLPSGIGETGVPIWQLVSSIVLLIVTFMGIVWLAAKIYRVGILMYGKKPTYRELFKWLKY